MLRARVWWARHRLDREIAAGHSTSRAPDVRLRASQLAAARCRRGVAAALRNLVDAADEPPGVRDREASSCAVNRHGIAGARSDLLGVAAHLVGDEPVPARAVALAQLLVFDPSSPLCGTASPDAVRRAVDTIRIAMLGP